MQDDFYEKEKNEFVPFFIGVVPIVILPISPINAIDNIQPVFVNNKNVSSNQSYDIRHNKTSFAQNWVKTMPSNSVNRNIQWTTKKSY